MLKAFWPQTIPTVEIYVKPILITFNDGRKKQSSKLSLVFHINEPDSLLPAIRTFQRVEKRICTVSILLKCKHYNKTTEWRNVLCKKKRQDVGYKNTRIILIVIRKLKELCKICEILEKLEEKARLWIYYNNFVCDRFIVKPQ